MQPVNEFIDVRVIVQNDRAMPTGLTWRGEQDDIVRSTLPAIARREGAAFLNYFVCTRREQCLKISYDLSRSRWSLEYILD